jgi:hypothetical protein
MSASFLDYGELWMPEAWGYPAGISSGMERTAKIMLARKVDP